MMINIYDFKRELDNKSIKYDMKDNCIAFFESVQGTNVLFEILFAELKIDVCETYVLGKTQPSLSFYKYLNEKNFEKVTKYTISELDDGNCIAFFESVQGTNVLFEILFAELKIDVCETYVLGKTQPSLSFYKYLNEKNFEKVTKYTISELDDGTWVLKYSLTFFKPSFDANECFNIMLFICNILENEIEETKKAYYR